MKEYLTVLFKYTLQTLYLILIWSLVLLLTYNWHIKTMFEYNLTFFNAMGIIILSRIITEQKNTMYPKEEFLNNQSTNYDLHFTPYFILLISFLLKLISF
jgi:hypothetical protein